MNAQSTRKKVTGSKRAAWTGIRRLIAGVGILTVVLTPAFAQSVARQPIVDTGQSNCFDNYRQMNCPQPDDSFSGQDAQYVTNPPAYRDNGDGTVTDLVTGLMWSKGVEAEKKSLAEAQQAASSLTLGGYNDWRVPNIKELYSLINFSGSTGSPEETKSDGIPADAVPYINTDYFDFRYGNLAAGERYMDAQWLSSTRYVSTTMDGNPTLFGVNFADGRIKGYPDGVSRGQQGEKKYYVRYVRGETYGTNDFVDNGDGTVTDAATGLMWMQQDSAKAMSWEEALEYANKSQFAGYSDWRLPDAKELQFLVDYTRSPDTTGSAAIDPVFASTPITNEAGQRDYPFYWSSTTHNEGKRMAAVYLCFGRGVGYMYGKVLDVHGAGAQRSDPKVGSPSLGGSPQGDAIRINNFVRLVRGGDAMPTVERTEPATTSYPQRIRYLPQETALDNQTSSPPANLPGKQAGGWQQRGGSRLQGGPPSGKNGERFVRRLDRDGDGKVSRAEFDGPIHHFDAFDKDRDGRVSAEEAPTGPPPPRRFN